MPTVQDYQISEPQPKIEKAFILKMRVCKRKQRVYKLIALPCDPKYEPWTLGIMKYLVRKKQTGEPVFGVSRHASWHIIRRNLSALDPLIHPHSLRQYWLSHLSEFYGFSAEELVQAAGWTHQSAGMHSMLDVYLHADWRKSFAKLLKPLP